MKCTRAPHLVLSLLLPVLALACGGGGGGDTPVATAAISFPPPGATTDADAVTVSGRSAPGTAAVAAVRVDGVDAQSGDGFATWTASVPLALGLNTLRVEVEDADGNVTPAAEIAVRREPLLQELRGIDHEPVRGIAWAVDRGLKALVAVDPLGGGFELVSGDTRGAGPLFSAPTDVVATPASSVVYVLDTVLDVIFAVDPATGDRTVLALSGSNLLVGFECGIDLDPVSGDLIVASPLGVYVVDPVAGSAKFVSVPATEVRGVAVDDANGDVYLLRRNSVDRVDLDAPALETVSSASVGKGPKLLNARAIDVDPQTGEIWVADFFSDVLRVDPSSGDRSLFFTPKVGDELGGGLTFDRSSEQVLVSDRRLDVVIAIETPGGEARVLVAPGPGVGPSLNGLNDLELQDGRTVALEDLNYTLLEIDLASGDRQRISGNGTGAGDPFEDVAGLAPDLERGRVVVTDFERLFEVVVATGERIPLAEPTAGGFVFPDDVQRFPDGRLFVLDRNQRAVFEIDPQSGEQTLASMNGDGLGIDFVGPQKFLADPTGNRLLVIDRTFGEVFVRAVDVDSGVRTTVVAEVLGNGPYPKAISSLALDEVRRVLYLGDGGDDQVLAVDLATGTRTQVSSDTRGLGPELDGGLDALAYDPQGERLLTLSDRYGALLAVSLESGDRVIVSR